MTEPQGVEEVTEEQAAEALQQLTSQASGVEKEVPEPQEVEQPAPAAETTTEEKADAPKEEPSKEEPAPEVDDVVSLQKRLTEAEKSAEERGERYEARIKAIQERSSGSQRILQDRYLRKSTVVDSALRVIEAAKTEAGVDPAEADRVIREIKATMHPDSASYVPAEPRTAATEDQELVLNNFLDEKEMTTEEAKKFGSWIQSDASSALTATEQAVAERDLDGFLRVAYPRWREKTREGDKKQKVDDAVGAVKSVQRTQREAARAASAPSAAPKKQPASTSTEVDLFKLPKEQREEAVSKLLRQATEQYL